MNTCGLQVGVLEDLGVCRRVSGALGVGGGDREAELTSGTLILLKCAISAPHPLGKSLGGDEERYPPVFCAPWTNPFPSEPQFSC